MPVPCRAYAHTCFAHTRHGAQTSYVCCKAEDYIAGVLPAVAGDGRSIVAVLDPSRSGLAPAMCHALRDCPSVRRVVYVSCNPQGKFAWGYVEPGGSFVQNAVALCGPPAGWKGKGGCAWRKGRQGQGQSEDTREREPVGGGRPFRPVFARPVDMFPQTPHCELVVVFERE